MFDGGIVGGEASVSEGVISTQAFEKNPMTPVIVRGTDCGWLSVTPREGLTMYYERMGGVGPSDLLVTIGR